MSNLKHKIPGDQPGSSLSNKSSGSAKTPPRVSEHPVQYYRSLFHNHPVPTILLDPETLEILEVNRAAGEFYGYTEKEFLSLNFRDLLHGAELLALEDEVKNRGSGNNPVRAYWKHVRKNGDARDVVVRGDNLVIGSGTIRLVVINDVSTMVKAESELKRPNEPYRRANEHENIGGLPTLDLVWGLNIEADEPYRDPGGWMEADDVKNEDSKKHIRNWLERIHPDDRAKVQNTIFDTVNAGRQNIFDLDYRVRDEDGEYLHIYDRGYILRNTQGKAYRIVGATQSLTERKRLEQDLLEQQKAISQATINTQEKERTEISKELHDNVNQVLTTTKLYLDLAIANPGLKDELIMKSSKNIISAITEIRKLSQSLMIPSLGDLGLIDSIDDLVENINATKKFQVVFMHDEIAGDALDENQKLTLFRIAQEALNNVVKHADATQAIIKLLNKEQTIQLMIHDNGKGFDSHNVKKGAGLNNMRNRVYLLNGNLTVDTQPGKGCTLVVELPHRH